MDTESDRFGDRSVENTRNVLLTVCPPSAKSLADVKTFFDKESAWLPFLDYFEGESEDFNIQWFNGGYEMGALWDALIEKGYHFISKGDFTPGTKRVDIEKRLRRSPHCAYLAIDKNAGFLECVITSGFREYEGHGHVKKTACRIMRIKDAAKIAGGKDTMSKNANAIRKVHPEWWQAEMNTKDDLEDEDYNNGWYFDKEIYPKKYERFMHYSIQDAYSQAMIFRYLKESGQDKGLSRSGNSWNIAIDLCETGDNRYFKKKNFQKKYPPLEVESQLLYEDGLLGGYVYGKTGVYEGVATKGDYKSSYPDGYWRMKLPSGREYIIRPEDPDFDRVMESDELCRFILCRFDFKLKSDIHQPCINAYECVDDDGERFVNALNKKMKEGHRRWMLTPEPYLNAVKRHYNISDLEVKEIHYFHDDGDRHYYRPAIREFFIDKEKNVKGSIFNLEAKLNMNGGMHGKNIQRIVRAFRDYDECGENKEKLWATEEGLSKSQYPFYVAMWVMMCRRACLLNDIAEANDRGVENLMADTDSMILACDEKTFREIYGDRVIDSELEKLLPKLWWDMTNNDEKDWFIEHTLGKISVELSDIRLFKCWGLKRYLCVNGKGKKSAAFAGMSVRGWFRGVKYSGDLQEAVLSMTDIDDELVWEQNALCGVPGMKHTKTIEKQLRHAQKENIWITEEMLDEFKRIKFFRAATQSVDYLESKARQMYLDMTYGLNDGYAMEDIDAEIRDKGMVEEYTGINRMNRNKRIKLYEREKWEEEKIRMWEGR